MLDLQYVCDTSGPVAPVTQLSAVSIRNAFEKQHVPRVHPTNPSDRKAFTLCLRITGIMLSASPSEVLDSNEPNSLEPRCMEIVLPGVSLYIYTLTNLFKLVPV